MNEFVNLYKIITSDNLHISSCVYHVRRFTVGKIQIETPTHSWMWSIRSKGWTENGELSNNRDHDCDRDQSMISEKSGKVVSAVLTPVCGEWSESDTALITHRPQLSGEQLTWDSCTAVSVTNIYQLSRHLLTVNITEDHVKHCSMLVT